MSYISDFKSSALALFNQAYSANPALTPITTAGTGVADPSLEAEIGNRYQTADGRTLALVRNGAVALTTGKLVQARTEVTAFELLAMTIPSTYPGTVGSTQILVTNGGTVLNANQFAGGYVVIGGGTGQGQTLQIASHQPAAASATFVITLADPVQVALSATSTVTLMANQYDGILIANHSTLGQPVGVTLYPLAASTAPTYSGTTGALTAAGVSQYGFIVVKGFVGCLIDALTNVGYPVGPSTNTDGAVNVATLTSSPQIGISAQTQTSTKTGLIFLNL